MCTDQPEIIQQHVSICSFKEIDKSTYTLEVKAMDDKLVTVTVPENQSSDIAGNYNLASSSIQVRHCTSISLLCFTFLWI